MEIMTFEDWKLYKATSVPELTENGVTLHRYYAEYVERNGN